MPSDFVRALVPLRSGNALASPDSLDDFSLSARPTVIWLVLLSMRYARPIAR